MDGGAWWAAVHGVAKSRTRLSDFTFTFHFHALEKERATHSSVLAWRIPGMAEPDGLSSMGSHRVGQDWSNLAAAAAAGMRLSSVIAEVKSFAFWFWGANLEASLYHSQHLGSPILSSSVHWSQYIHWPAAAMHPPQAFLVGRFQWDIFKGTAFTLDSGLLESFTRRISCKFHRCHTASSFGGPWGWPPWGVDLNPRGSLSLGCHVSALEIVALSYNSCFDTL